MTGSPKVTTDKALRNSGRVTTDASLGNVTLPEITVYGTVPKPGRPYDTGDDAALGAIFFINQKSKKELREYAGWIFQDPKDKKYYFSNPVKGEINDSHEGPKPHEMTIIGTYHTHGGRPNGEFLATDEIFSPNDKMKATLGKLLSYLGTPKNKVLKFTPIDLLPNQAQAQYPTGLVEPLFEGD